VSALTSPVAPSKRPSFLFLSAAVRLAAAGGVAGLLWLGVAWALRAGS
jgi:hypothetical protein